MSSCPLLPALKLMSQRFFQPVCVGVGCVGVHVIHHSACLYSVVMSHKNSCLFTLCSDVLVTCMIYESQVMHNLLRNW